MNTGHRDINMTLLMKISMIAMVIMLTSCENGQNRLFEFNEKTLTIVAEKLHEFENIEFSSYEDSVYPILVANLLEDSIVYDDFQQSILRDTTYKGRFNPSNLLNQNKRKVDIYRILFSGISNADNHILLINGVDMTFINMKQSYEKVIRAILRFFGQNDDIDPRLMPLYIQRITGWYLRNHWQDERGDWFDWFNEADSVSSEYYKFQYCQ